MTISISLEVIFTAETFGVEDVRRSSREDLIPNTASGFAQINYEIKDTLRTQWRTVYRMTSYIRPLMTTDCLCQKWYTHTITFASRSNGGTTSGTQHAQRFEPRRLVESVDSCVSSSQGVNGRSHNNIRNACDAGLSCLLWQDLHARTTFTRQEL